MNPTKESYPRFGRKTGRKRKSEQNKIQEPTIICPSAAEIMRKPQQSMMKQMPSPIFPFQSLLFSGQRAEQCHLPAPDNGSRASASGSETSTDLMLVKLDLEF